jgi:TolB-like protein/DNA-binding winged helix-turn-helix (wHTH) protein/Tfp pilus assembly protein PilF
MRTHPICGRHPLLKSPTICSASDLPALCGRPQHEPHCAASTRSIASPIASHRKHLFITRCLKENEPLRSVGNNPASLTTATGRAILTCISTDDDMKQSTLPVNSVRFGVFEFDLRSRELRKHGIRIKLQEQPCQILAFLLERRGEMVTREELQRHLWPSDTFVDFDHSLNTAVMRLREALNDSTENPRFIETLPRRGYRFVAPFEERSAPVAETTSLQTGEMNATQTALAQESLMLPPHSQVLMGTSAKKGGRSRRHAVALATMLALALALACGLGFRYFRKPSVVAAPPKQITSIVVLPLENLSADKDQAYFADGMTDELIANLAKIRSLRVISRTSAMGYKGTHKTLSEIARDLNVDAIVEGTVLRSGDRVRITAELVQVATDRHLWADTYESPFGDVLTLQSRVASAIVNEIRINLTPEEQQRLASTRPVSAASYEDYLKGRYYWNKRSEEGLNKAIEYFQLATQKDPRYALAYAGLADCYSIIGSAIVGTVPSYEVAPKAKAAALKALELDNTLAEAQTSLATVRFNYDWDWAAAATGFRRAIELNPSYATAYQRYSLYLMAMGRAQESLIQMNRARDLDPVSISMNFSLGWRLYMARQYDQAIEQLRNTLDMDPNFALPRMVLGQAYEQKGSYQQAIVELQKAASTSHDSPLMLGALGHAYGTSGNRSDAEKVLAQLMEQSKKQYVSPFYVAIVYAGLAENDKAVDWLEKAFKDRSNAIIFSKVDPQLDALRSTPRFQSLLRRLALQN